MKNWFKKNIWFLVGLILTLILLWPLFKAPYFSHHDDVQVIRLHQMDKCIKDGQIPCRWVPDLGGLYGYPLFNYYGPIPYYFGELFYLISGSLIFSVKVMFIASFVGSYVFMYLLGERFWGRLGGALSAVFYSLAPYHAVDFYVRGAMGEMWALMLFPAIFWSFIKLEEEMKFKNVVIAGLFLALLIASHNISAMIFVPVLLTFIAVVYFKRKNLRFIPLSAFALILALVLSSFYWLPAIMEKGLVHVETTTVGYFSYTEHFKGFRKLLLERSWGWGPSLREIPGGEKDAMSYQVGWVHLAVWGLALVGAFFHLLKKNKWKSLIIGFSSAIILASAFMINPRAVFIWDALPPLKFLQFPWRFLILIIFFVSFIAGSIFLWINKKFTKTVWIVLIAAVVLLNFSYFRPERFINVTQEQLLTGELWDKQIKRSIFDYLPVYAKAPPAELADKRYEILEGKMDIKSFEEGTNWLTFKAGVSEDGKIRLSKYFFPNWKVFVDGQQVEIDYDNDLGLITFDLKSGDHNVKVRLFNTLVRDVANFASLGGLLMIFILAKKQNA